MEIDSPKKGAKTTEPDPSLYQLKENGIEDDVYIPTPEVTRFISPPKARGSYSNIRALITRDIPRTFTELDLFAHPNSDGYIQLLNVLETAAVHLPHVGYVRLSLLFPNLERYKECHILLAHF